MLLNDGKIYTMGLNSQGQLGYDTTNSVLLYLDEFVRLNLDGIVKTNVGKSHTLVMDGEGRIFAWGSNEKH